MKMNIRTFSQIVEEVKSMPQEPNEKFTSGEEFEKWLKIRKQHYKEDFEVSIVMKADTSKSPKFNFESNKYRNKYTHDKGFDMQFSINYESKNNSLNMYNDLNIGMNYNVSNYNGSVNLIA